MSATRWLLLVLALAGGLRALQLDAPIIGTHSWRQADTAAIARNFAESGYRILHPQVDWRGDTSGDVESEFPLYPFLVALGYGLFGVSELWARGLSVLFALLTIGFLYRLVRRTTDEATALWSCGFYAILPLNVFFGRAVMPESLMLMASVAGVYCFYEWTRTGLLRQLALSALFVSTACLLKLPTLYLGAPLLYLALLRFGLRALWSPLLWAYAAAVLAPIVLWYWHAHGLFLETGLSFGIWGYGTDKWGNWDLVSSGAYWYELVTRFAHRHLTYPAFAIFVTGLALKRITRTEWLFDVWLLGLVAYLVIVGVGNLEHSYYQLPLLIPTVVFMGKVFGRYFGRPATPTPVAVSLALLLAASVITSGAGLRRLLKREDPEKASVFQLAEELRAVSEPSAKVISVGPDPTLLYLSHRKGWREFLSALTPERTDELVERGAVYAAGFRRENDAAALHELEQRYEGVVRDDRFYIVRLRSQPPVR